VTESDFLAESMLEFMQRYGVTRHVKTIEEAEGSLAGKQAWAGVVIDVQNPQGSKLQMLHAFRAAHPMIPVLTLCNNLTADLVNQCQADRMELICAPPSDTNLKSFVLRAMASECVPGDHLASFLDRLARSKRLTPREAQLMTFALGDDSRARIQQRLGITENTLKTQIRGLLRKCGQRSLEGLAKNVLRQAQIQKVKLNGMDLAEGPSWGTEESRGHAVSPIPLAAIKRQ